MPRLTDLAQLGTITLTSPGGSIEPPTPGAPYYNLTRTALSVTEESDTFDITLSTANVASGTSVPYTITGVSSADIDSVSLTGNFTVPDSNFQVSSYNNTVPISVDIDVTGNIPSGTYVSSGTIEFDGQILAVDSVSLTGTTLTINLPSNFSTEPTAGENVVVQGLIYSSGFWPQVSSSITFTTTPDITEEGNELFNLSLDSGADSVSVTIQDTSKPTYSLTGSNNVNEGASAGYLLTTTNITDGTLVPYTITGVSSADIDGASLTGNFTITSGLATLNLTITEDLTTEGNETLTLSLDNGKSSIQTVINDTSVEPLPITYGLSTTSNSVNEGDSFTINLSTTNADIGTAIPYVISGVTTDDISGASLTGNFTTEADGSDSIEFTVANDLAAEGLETFRLTVDNENTLVDVDIVDTSIPTFSVTANKTYVPEGETIIFSMIGTGALTGDSVSYGITGIDNSDISAGALNGTVNFSSSGGNTYIAQVTLTIAADTTAENLETITFTMDSVTTNGAVTGSPVLNVVVTDSSSTVSTFHDRIQFSNNNITLSKTCYSAEKEKFVVGTTTVGSAIWGVIIKYSPTNGLERWHRFRVSGSNTYFTSCAYDDTQDKLFVVGYTNDGQNNAIALRFDNNLVEDSDRFISGTSGDSGSVTQAAYYDCDVNNAGQLFAGGQASDGNGTGGLLSKFTWGSSITHGKLDSSSGTYNIENVLISPAGVVLGGFASIIYPKITVISTSLDSVLSNYRFVYSGRGRYPYANCRIAKSSSGTNYIYMPTNQPNGTYAGHGFVRATNSSGSTFSSSTMATTNFTTSSTDYLRSFVQVDSAGDEFFAATFGNDIFVTKDNTWQGKFTPGTGYTDINAYDFNLDADENWWLAGSQTSTSGRIDGFVLQSLNGYAPSSQIGDFNIDDTVNYSRGATAQRLTTDTSYRITSVGSVPFGSNGTGYTSGYATTNNVFQTDINNITVTRETTIWVGTATYSLSRSATSINEGQSVTITLTTTEVNDGTLVPYAITGIGASDLSSGAITGNFTVNSNTAALTFTTSQDVTTEGTENMTLSLSNGQASVIVQINDTSAGPDTYYLASADLPDGYNGGRGLLAEADIGETSSYKGWSYWTWISPQDPYDNYIYADDQNGENIWRIEIDRLLFKMTQDANYLYFIHYSEQARADRTVGDRFTIMKVAKSDGEIVSRRTFRNGSNFGTFQDPNYGRMTPMDMSYNSTTGDIGFAFLLTNENTDNSANGMTGEFAAPRLGMTTIDPSNLSNGTVYMKRMSWGSFGGTSVYTLYRYDGCTLIPRGNSGYTLCMNGGYNTDDQGLESRICFVNYTSAGAYSSNRVLTGVGTNVDDYTYSEPYIGTTGDWSMIMSDATYISNVGSVVVTGIFFGDSQISAATDVPFLVEYYPDTNAITSFKRARGGVNPSFKDHDYNITYLNHSHTRGGPRIQYDSTTNQLWTAWSERCNDPQLTFDYDDVPNTSYFIIRLLGWSGSWSSAQYYHSWTVNRQHAFFARYDDLSYFNSSNEYETVDTVYGSSNFVHSLIAGATSAGDPFIRLHYSCHNVSPFRVINQVAKIPSGGFGVTGGNTVTFYADNANDKTWDSGFNIQTSQTTDAGPTLNAVRYRFLGSGDPHFMNGTSIDVDDVWVEITDSNINTSSATPSNYGTIQGMVLQSQSLDNPTIVWLGAASGADAVLGGSSWHLVNDINTIYRLGNFVPYTG